MQAFVKEFETEFIESQQNNSLEQFRYIDYIFFYISPKPY